MGFFDWDNSSQLTRRSSGHHSSSSKRDKGGRSITIRKRSRSRSRSPAARGGLFGLGGRDSGDESYSRRNKSSSSFFGMPNVSTRSFFGIGSSHRGSSSSYYKRSSRPGFVNRAYRHLKRILRDLVYYAKRHPVKVFVLVIMPLITGGALTALLARFGLRMPPALERMLGLGAKAVRGDGIGLVGEAVNMFRKGGNEERRGGGMSFERGMDGGMQWERNSWEKSGFGGRDEGWGGAALSAGLLRNVGKFF